MYIRKGLYICFIINHKQLDMENLIRTKIQVSDLEIGMTVEWNGNLYTVGKESVRKTDHGMAFNGDASSKTITRVQFLVPTINGTILR